MDTPKSPTWSQAPHDAVRDQLLQHCLQSWLSRQLGGRTTSVTYADGFAGPGRYGGGEPGAPLIAYREAQRAVSAWPGKQVNMVFVEERSDRLEILRGELGESGDLGAAVPTTYRQGRGAQALAEALAVPSLPAGPVFALLDGRDGGMTPFGILPRIAADKAGEVILTFTPGRLSRFGTGEIQSDVAARIFGGTHWNGVFRQLGSAKYTYLVTQYRASLALAGFEHVLSVEILGGRGGEVHMIFATNSSVGLKTMKDILWSLGPVADVRYRDPRDPNQEPLEIRGDPADGPLRRQLLMVLRDHPDGMSIKQLREFALAQTVYRGADADRSIRILMEDGFLENTAPGALTQRAVVRLVDPPTAPHAWPRARRRAERGRDGVEHHAPDRQAAQAAQAEQPE